MGYVNPCNHVLALALSAHTPRVHVGVCSVRASWRLELDLDMPGRYQQWLARPRKILLLFCFIVVVTFKYDSYVGCR